MVYERPLGSRERKLADILISQCESIQGKTSRGQQHNAFSVCHFIADLKINKPEKKSTKINETTGNIYCFGPYNLLEINTSGHKFIACNREQSLITNLNGVRTVHICLLCVIIMFVSCLW